MPELHSYEDEAALYVLGELSAARRREFEARMAESADLCALVRELESGATTLAMASPPKQPPQYVWNQIQKTITKETRRAELRVLWVNWWKSGWAVATACFIGWMAYAFWPGKSATSPSQATTASRTDQQATKFITNETEEKTAAVSRPTPSEMEMIHQLLQSKTQEISTLKWQLNELQNRVADLSQSVLHQQALLNESNRLKFYQLVPVSDSGTVPDVAQISPELQRAMFLAMARELGWLQMTNPAFTGKSAQNFSQLSVTNQSNVDFVDLPPPTNSAANPPQVHSNIQPPIGDPSKLSAQVLPGTTVPAFVMGDSVFLGIDPAAVPAGSQFAFFVSGSDQEQYSLGSTTVGNNPMVVTLHGYSYAPVYSANGIFLNIITWSQNSSNGFQYFIPQSVP